jgi:DNA-directed RNA polymerase subunit H (RpoH/RPB5)
MDRVQFVARKNVSRMLLDRGYQNNNELLNLYNMQFEDVKTQIDLNKFNLELTNEKGDKISLVSFIVGESKFKKDDLIGLYNYAKKLVDEKNVSVSIIVVMQKVTPVMENLKIEMNKQYRSVDKKPFYIRGELWAISSLQFNPLDSNYVPKYTLLEHHEVENLLKLYNCNNINQLPRMLTGDPVAKHLGLRSGDVVKVEDHSETTGKTVKYRTVV